MLALVPKLRLRLSTRDEFQSDAVIAPALSCRRRAIVKEMTLMTTAAHTVVFGSRQDQLEITFGADTSRDRLRETRPTCSAVECRL